MPTPIPKPSAYDDVADWYDAVLRGGAIVQHASMAALHALAHDVMAGAFVILRVAKGSWRGLADRGAHVVGVDTSVKLLGIARADEAVHPRSVEYVEIR